MLPRQYAAFRRYYEELVVWNEKFNLTAITGYEQVQVRHFLDSLSCLIADDIRATLARPNSSAIDVGTGAGFPGIPLRIVCGPSRLTLLEATGKKVSFLEHLVETLDLNGVRPIHSRAEQLAHEPSHRGAYDIAFARAVAELPVLVEYALPFCKIGGYFVAMKGESGNAEAWNAERATMLLGGELQSVIPVHLPHLPEDRSLIVIQKVGPTPVTYPRRPGIPSKRPLLNTTTKLP
ncbi:16S rRNA (guanine(527)-N(7))-methyltransferase RsmG [Chloroflexota bacterium]